MKVTPSVLVGSLSGKSGGTVASNWKGRQLVRRHVIPHNPKTAGQLAQRAHMARMSTWFRSLPATLVTKLNELGTPLQMSGFNVMTKEDLHDLAISEPPEIIPGNPENDALFSCVDAFTITANQIDIGFVAGAALATHYVVALTCPVDPAEVALEEPDGWTLAATPVLVSAAAYDSIVVLNSAKSYWVVLIVIDTATLVAATKISGGVSCVAVSGGP